VFVTSERKTLALYNFQVAKLRVNLLTQIARSGHISRGHFNTHYLETQILKAQTVS